MRPAIGQMCRNRSFVGTTTTQIRNVSDRSVPIAIFPTDLRPSETDERVQRTKTQRRRACRDRQSGGPGAPDRARDPLAAVSAIQHSVRIDERHPAGGRLSVRLAIQLWLQPLFIAIGTTAVLRPDLRRRAETR